MENAERLATHGFVVPITSVVFSLPLFLFANLVPLCG